jgi:RNA polymerase sigma-70 factor (ECF subfamily)
MYPQKGLQLAIFFCLWRKIMKKDNNINMSLNKKERFEKLFAESRGKLFSIAFSVVRNKDSAEDVLQTSYIKAWNNFDSYDSSKKFTNWMTSIVKNASIDSLRNKTRQLDTYSLEYFNRHTQENDTFDIVDSSANLEQSYEQKEFLSEVFEMINQLPEDLREVMNHLIDDKSYAEISEQMKLPLNTIRTKVHRAKKILRKNADSQFLANFGV